MDEIEEQDNLNQNKEEISFEYRDGIKLFEDYRDSNYSKDYINELDEKDQCIIGYYIQLISDSFNIKFEDRNNDLICKLVLGLLRARDADEKKENYLIKENVVINFLTSKALLNSICRYVVKYNYSDIWDNLLVCSKVRLMSEENFKFDIERTIDIEYLIHLLLPYVYNNREIDTYLSKLKEISNPKEKLTYFLSIDKITSEIIKEEYKNNREFYEEIEKRIKNANFAKLITPLGSRVIKMDKNIILQLSKFTTLEFKEEYNNWKNERYNYSSSYHLIQYYYFWIYYIFIDKQLLYYFFRILNEPHAFDKNQIDYIREMAPKLRISSYLNEEYAEYKKWHNPDARDFDFGEDEPEEEVEDEDVLLESEQIDEADLKDENIEKLHLKRLSRFTKEQLIELLKKFRDRKEPFFHKKSKQKNWLFVFGMNGDTPPKGFEKIKWEAKYNGRIAKGALIDFLELLGYNIAQLYHVDSIKILNECFECYNNKNEKSPIDQNDFHYIGKTKEREYSKAFYNIFKEIIEGIEKQP